MKFQIIAGELCLDFINTLDHRFAPERRQELVPSYADLVDWAMQAGAWSAAQGGVLQRLGEAHPRNAEEVRLQALELRECLFRMVSAATKNRRPAAEDLLSFNHYLGQALSHLELQPEKKGFRLGWPQSELPLDSVWWPIVRSARDLLTGNELQRVRECEVGTCGWLFVDRSKNHSRRWCDMKVCGNRIKARKFYKRQSSGRRKAIRTTRNAG